MAGLLVFRFGVSGRGLETLGDERQRAVEMGHGQIVAVWALESGLRAGCDSGLSIFGDIGALISFGTVEAARGFIAISPHLGQAGDKIYLAIMDEGGENEIGGRDSDGTGLGDRDDWRVKTGK